jgi:glycogen(starch) synthase
MRILYWTESFWPTIGGIEILSAQFIPAMQKRGFEITVATDHRNLNLPDKADFKGIAVHRFHFQRALEKRDMGQLIVTLRQVAKLKQTFRPDLIHINTCGPGIFFHLRTIDTYSTPTLVTVHALMTRACGHDTILGRLLRLADWVSTVSEATLYEIQKILPEITHRSSVIYNGLNIPDLQPEPLPFDTPRLLCLGRVVVDKGFDIALTAFASLTHRFPNARLIIAGNGPAMSDLKKYTAEIGLTDSVEFTGWVSPEKIPHLLNTATVVLMPSRLSESFGLVALQTAQMARPIVATSIGGLPEVVTHGETGLLVEKENSDMLAKAIAFLLEHPRAAIQMGQNARKRVQKVFSWDHFVDNYDTLYRRLFKEVPVDRNDRVDRYKSESTIF